MSNRLTLLAAAAALSVTAAAHAASVSNDFETAGTYDLLTPAVSLSTEQSHSATHSIKFTLPDASAQTAVRVAVTPPIALKDVAGSFWAYVPSASGNTLAPYMYLGVDSDNDGIWNAGLDSLVLAFSGGAVPASFANDTWFQTGIDASTNVHVANNRPGLAANTFVSSGGNQDTLANLANVTAFGTTKWGDLNVLRAYAGAGAWPGATNYTAFADDISVSAAAPAAAAPLPSSALAGLTLLSGLAATRRRRPTPA